MSGKFKNILDKAITKMVYILSGDAAHGLEKNLGFAVFIFFLVCATITWSLIVENDLVKIKTNERTIEELRIHCQQLELDYIGMNNRTRIDKMLHDCGSTLHPPVVPPEVIVIK